MNPLACSEPMEPALLVLENGQVFEGFSAGAPGTSFGEVVFNTSMIGYQEIITDPSYAGQLVCFTYPQIGNYGINALDGQAAHPALAGIIVNDLVRQPRHWLSAMTLPDYLMQEGIVAIEGIDTRALTLALRETGAQRGAVSTQILDAAELLDLVRQSAPIGEKNLVGEVSCSAPYEVEASPLPWPKTAPQDLKRVVAYDCGEKRTILTRLIGAGCALTVVPWDTPASQVLALEPDGVFFSNGPGDPQSVPQVVEAAAELMGRIPAFGICLGNQVMSLAAGASIEKLLYGHHGGNEPVMNLLTGRCEVTSQNHNYGPVFSSFGPLIPELSGGIQEHQEDLRFWARCHVAPVALNPRFGRVRLTHVNLNDGTCEGIQFLDIPAFSMQYHPEAAPGPHDAAYAFKAFRALMDHDPRYLDAHQEKAGMLYA